MLPSHDALLAPHQPDPRPVLGAGMPPASALQSTVLLCRVQCGLSPAPAQVGRGLWNGVSLRTAPLRVSRLVRTSFPGFSVCESNSNPLLIVTTTLY